MMPHLNAAYNLARWLMRNDHEAEDVVQEAYLRALRFFESFRGEDGRAWLLAIVRNTCRTWQQRPSVATLSSAMDVGDPSNLERLSGLFGDVETGLRLMDHGDGH